MGDEVRCVSLVIETAVFEKKCSSPFVHAFASAIFQIMERFS